eukprot:892434-Alexandrium_andersonii.AAC.1
MVHTPRAQAPPHVGRRARRRPAKSAPTNARATTPRPAKGNCTRHGTAERDTEPAAGAPTNRK